MLGSRATAWADVEHHSDRPDQCRVDGDQTPAGAQRLRAAAGTDADEPAPHKEGRDLFCAHAADAWGG